MELIKVKEVTLKINNKIILDNINLNFEKGKIHGLVGRNGSGKSMLMKSICGFVRVSKGSIVVNKKVVGVDVDFPENIGIIIESPGFINYYSGLKNLLILSKVNSTIKNDKIRETMIKFGLDPDLKIGVSKYSLGMKQRLALCQATMEDPEILILDEPMNGLDKDGVNDVRRYLKELKEEGKTIILASHSSEDIEILCDTVNELDKGKIIKG